MHLTPLAKVVVAIGVAVALAGYLVLLDFGINAGRIHRGVSVAGLDLGGMTVEEARAELAEWADELEFSPVVLIREGFDCDFVPEDLGWNPRPADTAQVARDVGFQGPVFEALGERVSGWFDGVEVRWAGGPQHWKVTAHIDECERQAEALGFEIDRYKLRRKIRRALSMWPRRPLKVPLEES